MNIKNIKFNADDKTIFINITFALLIKGLALLVTFISTPLYIKYFNNQEVLGLWFTILSVLSWTLTFDFGIGNGLRNKLVYAINNNDKIYARKIISSSYIMIGIITLVLVLIGVPTILVINWNSIFNIDSLVISENILSFSVLIAFLSISVQFFLRIISYILYAIQKSAVNNFISLSISILIIIGLLIVTSGNIEQNLIRISFVYFIASTAPYLITSIIVFTKSLKNMFPSRKYYDKNTSRDVLKLGGGIFYNQVIYMLLTSTNAILITRFFGPAYVVNHEIYHKVFYLIPTLFTILLSPLWSAVTKMHAKKDFKRIKYYFNLTILLGLIISVFQFIPVFFLQDLFDVWLRNETFSANRLYASIFAIFGTIFILQNIVSTYALGLNKIKIQAFMYTIALVAKLTLMFFFSTIVNSWILIILIDSVVFLPYVIIEYFTTRKIILNLSDVNREKEIFYLAHYDLLNKQNTRNVHPGAVYKIDYVVEKLVDIGYKVNIISFAIPKFEGKYKSETIMISEKISLKLFKSFFTNNMVEKAIRKLLNILSILYFTTTAIKKNDLIIVYHSMNLSWIVRYLKIIKKAIIIYDIGELYGDQIDNLKTKKKEINMFKHANAYIFPNDHMFSTYSSGKPSTILYGVYGKVALTGLTRFNDDKVHCVYSGTLTSVKKGSSNAIRAGEYLGKNFHIHILGISSDNEIKETKELIREVSLKTECTITYDGTLYDEQYLLFLMGCNIGLATQTVNSNLNDTSFPSKILTYMSAGLNIVSSEISAVKNSKLAENIEFYQGDDPKEIANAIIRINRNQSNTHFILDKLDKKFRDDIEYIINTILGVEKGE